MKKKILSVFLAGVMALGLAACGGADGDSAVDVADPGVPAAEEQTVLRMAWWGSQTRHDRTVAAIELYESEHPDVDIEYEYYSADDYFTKLQTLVASHEVWDIFQMGGNFPAYIDSIQPLDGFVDEGIIDVSDVPEAYLSITRDADGNLVGFSNGINTYGIAYDADLFEECGIPAPAENWTWDDFAEAARTIHEHTGMFGVRRRLQHLYPAVRGGRRVRVFHAGAGRPGL